jgi:carboxymethylenebutenolidase
MSAVIRAAMTGLSNAQVVDDTGGMIAFLDGQEQVSPGPIGCVGHCMSGPFVTTIAAKFSRVRATAALYGVDMVTDKPDSPHLLAGRIAGEFYAGFAEVDPSVGPGVIPALKAELEKAGVRHCVEVVPGTHHGYCFAARPDYQPVAAEATWDTLMDLFERNLKANARP